jgi:hypothetical protein
MADDLPKQLKAVTADLPASGLTGGADLKDKAGDLEAALLAAKAVGEAAIAISATISNFVPAAGAARPAIVIVAAAEVPAFQASTTYDLQAAIVKQALDDAIAAVPARRTAFESFGVPAVAAAGLALDAANKLLSFFRTDFTVSAAAVSLDDGILVNAVASHLHVAKPTPFKVFVPGIFNPAAAAGASGKALLDELMAMASQKRAADDLLKERQAAIERLGPPAGAAEADDAKQAREQSLATQLKLAGGLRCAIAAFDGWFGKLAAADDKGGTLLGVIAREKAIQQQLKEGHLLVLKIQKSGGGLLVKKTVWTAFGGTPIFYSGGAVVTYTLLDGQSGAVITAGVHAIHGGFVNANDLREKLKTP